MPPPVSSAVCECIRTRIMRPLEAALTCAIDGDTAYYATGSSVFVLPSCRSVGGEIQDAISRAQRDVVSK
jgi:hypothetical protein